MAHIKFKKMNYCGNLSQERLFASEPVMTNGKGRQTRNFAYVGDYAYANYLVATVGHGYLSASKADKELAWSPTLSLEERLKTIVIYFSEKERLA